MGHGLIIRLFLLLALAGIAEAKEWEIVVKDERPVPPLGAIISKLAPGDTVKFLPAGATLRAEIVLRDVAGGDGQPIVIDGNDCTFLGAEKLRPEEWEALGGGLYKSEKLAARLKLPQNLLMRWFFVFDGRMERMGRVSKGPQPPLPKPDSLEPGKWTFDQNAFYVKIPDGQTLDEARIEVPERQSGVAIAGTKSAHLEIRNLKVRHFANDGFNIHGRCEAVKFANIAAEECGDDGLSAHEECSVEAVKFFSRGNATGFCNVNQSRFTATDVTLADNLAYEIFITDSSQNSVSGLSVESRALHTVTVRGGNKDDGTATLALKDATIKASAPIAVEKKGSLSAENLQVEGCNWAVNGSANVQRSRLAGRELAIAGDWTAADNTYQFSTVTLHGRRLTLEEFLSAQQQPSSP